MCINIGNRREVFWDDALIDINETTACLTMHKPVKRELAITIGDGWEKDGISYPHCIKIGDEYYMYYMTGMPIYEKTQKSTVGNEAATRKKYVCCVMKTRDFVNWERPDVGTYSYPDMTQNNIVISMDDRLMDNMYVFYDENPDCPAEEKYKGVGMGFNDKDFPEDAEFWLFTSPDGLHFTRSRMIWDGVNSEGCRFDTLNITWYDKIDGVYKSFVRGIHPRFEGDDNPHKYIRDIRYSESKDFINWTIPRFLDYGEGAPDYPLYTNQIRRYDRAPHMYIGFPTRYVEREAWSLNFDQLGGSLNAKMRKERMAASPREGLAITDGIFMSSRDGLNWNRFDEVFIGGEPEYTHNWAYGDSYNMYNLFETPCAEPVGGTELSLFVKEGTKQQGSINLYRYTMRLDGFASYHAGYEVKTLTTKPFIYDGSELSINFSTSAIGFVYVDILDETGKPIEGYHSCELFGNTTDRTVYFGEDKDVSKLAGRPVKLRFTMRDADMYAFIFR